MLISTYSDSGRVRLNNEDSHLAIGPWQEPALSRKTCIFAVADGMGGHASGEVASRLAADSLRTWLEKRSSDELTIPLIEAAFAEANSSIFQASTEGETTKGMGTTLTSAFVNAGNVYIGHVGDSRAYLFRNQELRQLTRDHTLVAEQIRLGNITPEQAAKHPARHILSRAMGVREFLSVDTILVEALVNDILFLCSDGIYGMISDEDIKQILVTTPIHKAAKILVMEANKAGGQDNSTAVVIQFTEIPVQFPEPYSIQHVKNVVGHWWNRFLG